MSDESKHAQMESEQCEAVFGKLAYAVVQFPPIPIDLMIENEADRGTGKE